MPGNIIKEEGEPYTFTVEESITISFRYTYNPEQESPEDAVFNTEKNKELA